MYKRFKCLFFLIFFNIIMFVGLNFVSAEYNYMLIGYALGNEQVWGFEESWSIELTNNKEGHGDPYSNLGGDEEVLNWEKKDYPPNIILVTTSGLLGVDWYGYDSLDVALKNAKDLDHIFALDSYYHGTLEVPDDVVTDTEINYSCEYDTFTINFNKEGKPISADGKYTDISLGLIYTYSFSENFKIKGSETPSVCANVSYCKTSNPLSESANVYSYMIFRDSLDYEANIDSCYDGLLFGISSVNTNNFESGCPTYGDYYRDLEKFFLSCNGNNLGCSEYKNTKEKFKSLCHSIISNKDYDSDDCLKRCLKLSNDINVIEKNKDTNKGSCGFSWNLIQWIANIVRWGKYLIPVIVIVLGILDFIKAIAADKDDEMKKAQGRFVKRLIAAALIFIIPFIIEFVLGKLGFDSNGCGIIDL